MGVELKPCPFCGSTDLYVTYIDAYRDGTAVVFCNSCKVSAVLEENEEEGFTDKTRARAIEAWNTRAERTCRWTPADFITEGEWWNTECGEAFTWEPDGTPNHCPNCGAKVVVGE